MKLRNVVYNAHIHENFLYMRPNAFVFRGERRASRFLLLFSPVIVTRPEFMDLLIRTGGKNQRR